MSNLTYWEKRFLQTKASQIRSTEEYERALQSQLKGLLHQIDIEANQYYRRYSQNNDIPEEKARKILNNIGNSNWNMTLEQFKQRAIKGGYEKELDNEYFKSRIARLQNLETQIKNRAGNFAKGEQSRMGDALAYQYKDSYMRTIYNYQITKFQYSADFAGINDDQLKTIISKPWSGNNFSKRIWHDYQEVLPDKLMDTMLRGSLLGYAPSKISNMMHARFQDIKKKDIHRLVVSEMGHVNEEATLRAYEESGIEEYEYMATLESHTCVVCARLDGQVFKLSERKDGINYPIIHAHCRCTTVPHIDGLPESGERWMRDPDTGKGKLVKSISFKEWNRKYGNNNISESGSAFRNGTNEVDLKYISSAKYRNKFSRITDNSNVNDVIRRLASGMLTKHSGTDTEDLYIIHSDTGKILIQLHGGTGKLTPGILNDDQKKVLSNNKGKTIAIHNHPTNVLPDGSDYQALMTRGYDKGIIVGHDGSVFEYGCMDSDIDTVKTRQLQRMLDNKIANLLDYNYNMGVNKAFEKAIKSLERGYKIWFEKIT